MTPQSMAWIEPGSIVDSKPPPGWSHVILVAHSRVGAEDVNEVSSMVVGIAQRFLVAIVASVRPERDGSEPAYVLERVGIGIGTQINGKNMVISTSTQAVLGANLGIVERQVLATTERSFKTGNRQIARTPTMIVFDGDVILLVGGQHKPMITRYAALAAPDTGRLEVLSWLLQPTGEGDFLLSNRPLQRLAVPLIEQRTLSVKADRFVLGVPSSDAFAQVKPTSGEPLPWTDRLRRDAARRTFSASSLADLETELSHLLDERTEATGRE